MQWRRPQIVILWGSELKTWSFSCIIASTHRVLLPILLCRYCEDFSQLSKRPRIRSQKTSFLFARQRALNKTGVIFLLQIKTNSCALNSTCMNDKLATSACGFYLQKVLNFISKCGGIEPCFKPRGSVKRRCHLFLILSLFTRVIAKLKSAFYRSISFVWLCPES